MGSIVVVSNIEFAQWKQVLIQNDVHKPLACVLRHNFLILFTFSCSFYDIQASAIHHEKDWEDEKEHRDNVADRCLDELDVECGSVEHAQPVKHLQPAKEHHECANGSPHGHIYPMQMEDWQNYEHCCKKILYQICHVSDVWEVFWVPVLSFLFEQLHSFDIKLIAYADQADNSNYFVICICPHIFLTNHVHHILKHQEKVHTIG